MEDFGILLIAFLEIEKFAKNMLHSWQDYIFPIKYAKKTFILKMPTRFFVCLWVYNYFCKWVYEGRFATGSLLAEGFKGHLSVSGENNYYGTVDYLQVPNDVQMKESQCW